MANYVNQSTQTDIAGLTRDPALLPAPLFTPRPPRDNITPPEDMMDLGKLQLPAECTPAITKTNMNNLKVSSTLLLRRKNRPKLEARISMSEVAQFVPQTPRSPPTEAIMSPLPLQNKLYAGHTPIMPRSMSPLADVDDDVEDDVFGEQEQADEALSGPLTLPPQPGDGTEDTIPLSVLDATLERLRLEQEHFVGSDQIPTESEAVETVESVSRVLTHDPTSSRSRTGPAEVRQQCIEVVDGVILKKPRINFGAPIGQV